MGKVIHELKIQPHNFSKMKSGERNFDVRYNGCHFDVGDELILKEFVPKDYYEDTESEYYTGNILHRKVIYILDLEEIGAKGYIVLGLEKI